MGDRHGGCFARRGRTLSPPRPQVDAHREVGFRWRATAFRCRGVVGRICPAREGSPQQKPPDTARRRKDLPRARTRPSAKASRHGARAKRFAPRRNTPLGESLPTRREGERICPAQKHAPRRRLPDTAHERKDLPRAGTRPSEKASRHGARAKRFARARTLSSAKVSRHGARAKGFAPRRNTLLGEGLPTRRASERICAAGVRVCPTCRQTAGRPRPTDSRKTPLRRGRTHSACGHCRVHSPKKIRLLHETQLFYGESHVGSPHLFLSFPSVGRCVARERNPVPPVAPHRGSEPRGLPCTGEMVRQFDAMCPRGGEWLPRGGNGWPCGGRCDPGLRCFGERFHRRRCANPDACRDRRCSRG